MRACLLLGVRRRREVAKTEAHSQARPRKVVLIVEDEPTIGALIAETICDEPGFCAIHVGGPAAALETTKHVTPDVMVVDVPARHVGSSPTTG
jgi:hypothetical protein